MKEDIPSDIWICPSLADTWGVESAGPQPHTPKNKIKKKTDFVDTIIPNVLCDSRFSLNQPLKSAGD